MTSRLRKFSSGILTHPVETIVKSMRYGWTDASLLLEAGLFKVIRPLLPHLSAGTQARIKEALGATVRLDYDRQEIRLHADSELSIHRARACAKEPETVEWIEKFMHEDEVFYDVGANVGAYSLVASKHLMGRIQIEAFEPSFSTYALLCRNILLNGCQDSIHPHLAALTDRSHLVEFEYRSLEAGAAEHHMTVAKGSRFPEPRPAYRQSMIGFRIDDLIADFGFPVPNHMKIDVDGAEIDVLRGATRTLGHDGLRSLLVEVRCQDGQEQDVVNLLKLANFEILSRHDRGDGVVWNYIFVKKNRSTGKGTR